MFGPTLLPRNIEASLRDARDAKLEVRISALRDLARHAEAHREKVVDGLVAALSDAEAAVRAVAARALGDVEAHASLDALIAAADDRAPAVAEAAIESIGLWASSAAERPLPEAKRTRARERLQRALRDKRGPVRFQALMAYPRAGATRESAVAALVEAASDADELVAHIAFRVAEELADQGDEGIDSRLVERAARALTHRSPRVRAVAAVVLASADDPRGDRAIGEIVDGSLATPELEDVAAAIELAGARALRATIPALERRAFGGFFGIGRDALAWHARTALARMSHPRATAAILSDLGALSHHTRTLAVAAAGRAHLVAARSKLLAMRGLAKRADPAAVEGAIAEIEASGESAAEAG